MDYIGRDIVSICGTYQPTPVIESLALARMTRVRSVSIKREDRRPLGNFKSLGGMIAGLRLLARHAGVPDIRTLLASPRPDLPPLVCASDGNHGLAVAAAAQRAGTQATIFLPAHVDAGRTKRIIDLGAQVVRTHGTYDDAVDAAAGHSISNHALLIADTSCDPRDPTVTSVTAGYGLIASELQTQLAGRAPTHLFVQAGVGGLAAALSKGLSKVMVAPAAVIVVEPASAACVAAGLAAAGPVRIAGNLNSCASMLSCGQASAAALEVLRHNRARCLSVDEAMLSSAVDVLQQRASVSTTPSGAAGFAGLMTAARSAWWQRELQLTARSDVLLVVTERCQPDPAPV